MADGYALERERDLADAGPTPHGGRGTAIYHRFFSSVDTPLHLNRVDLAPGATVAVHRQACDEIFYVLSGGGVMEVDGERFAVEAGDAVLTCAGHEHGLEEAGGTGMTVLVIHAGRSPIGATTVG